MPKIEKEKPHHNTIHGEAGHNGSKSTKEYRAYHGMFCRCYNPNNSRYKSYGGRGIKVCDRWRNSYSNFLLDMGRAPSPKHSLDRKDNDKDYGPDNCRWATDAEQALNKSTNRILEIEGQRKTLTEWCALYETNYKAAHYRLKSGWDVLTAVSKPSGPIGTNQFNSVRNENKH